MNKPSQTIEIKLCKKCKTIKPLEEYYKRGGGRRGYLCVCKECIKKYYHDRWFNVSLPDREIRRARYRKWFNDIKKEIFDHYGRKCKCCGEENWEFLTIDHINGGGTKHRKDLGGGTSFFKWLRDNSFPKEFRVLCINCNFSMGRFGYCPHKRGEKNAQV